MLGHVIICRTNKQGSIYVPEVALRFEACPGGRRGWINVFSTDGMYCELKKWPPTPIMPMVEWLRKNCDFVKEVDVPLMLIRFAIEAEEKKRRQIEAFSGLLKDMTKDRQKPLDLKEDPDREFMQQGVLRVTGILDDKEPGEISDEKKYAMALQIQRWIHEAGGLC